MVPQDKYLQAICRVGSPREGAWAEVVADGVRQGAGHGVVADHIHVNGPFKPDDAAEKAVRGRRALCTWIIWTSWRALERIAEAAWACNRASPSRVNLAVDGLPAWSR